jgi:uncharacterized protein
MIKWLLVVGVVAAIYVFFIKKTPSVGNKQTPNDDIKDDKKSNDMVQCSTCSIYCELDDALLSGTKYYCSRECLEKA